MSIIQEMPQKIHAMLKKPLIWLDAMFLLLLIGYILSGIKLVPLHGDESIFTYMSRDYEMIVKQGNFHDVLFSTEGGAFQNIRLSIGSILTFSIGFAKDIVGTDGPFRKWIFGSDQNGSISDAQTLYLGRICSALMGGFSIVFFFLTVYRLFPSRLVAWVSTLVLATHGDILVNFRRAMQEGPKFLFLTFTIYIATCILGNFQRMKMYRYLYVLLGVASGLALAAKQDIAPMLIAVYLALALIPIWKKFIMHAFLTNIFYLAAATILAFTCFLAFMPIFWGWWESVLALAGLVIILFQLPVWKIDRASKPLTLIGCLLIIGMTIVSPTQWRRLPIPITSMIETRKTLLRMQVDYLKENNLFYLDTVKDKFLFLLETTFSSKVMYFEVYDYPHPTDEQIAAYENSFISGRTGSRLVDGLMAFMVAVGGRSLLRQFSEESLLTYSLLIASGILLFATVPLPWQRYFLIMQIPYSLIAGVGAKQAWAWGTKFIEQRIRR